MFLINSIYFTTFENWSVVHSKIVLDNRLVIWYNIFTLKGKNMYIQELYKRNPKKFERFLLSDYPAIYRLKLDEITDTTLEFELYIRDDYCGRMIVTDYYVDEPVVSSIVKDCRYSAKSMKLAEILTGFAGEEYIKNYTEYRAKVKDSINYKFDCETENIINKLNCIANNINKLK